jgi:hypothetical protein
MVQPIFFTIPRASLVTLPKYFRLSSSNDVQVAYQDIRAWGYSQQDRGLVVIIDLDPPGAEFGTLEYGSIVAYDGLWVQQLLNWTTDESGGGGTGGQGDLRVAAGGFYGLFTPAVTVNFPAAGAFVELDQSVISLQPYAAAGSSNVTYNAVNNRLVLDWTAPVPTSNSWLQGMAVLTLAATNNNQSYAVAFGVNGTVESQFQVQFIRENPGDSETVTLHGHRQVPNGTELSIFVANLTSTSPVEISNVNFRFFGNNDVS